MGWTADGRGLAMKHTCRVTFISLAVCLLLCIEDGSVVHARRPARGGRGGPAKGKPVLKVGDTTPTRATLRDLGGKVVDLGLLVGPGARWNPRRPAALLLDFYTTTCGPCNLTLPALGEIASRFRERKLRTLLVSLDGTERSPGGKGISTADLKEKVATARLPDNEVLRDPGWVLAEDFGLVTDIRDKSGKRVSRQVGVPRTFIIDASGKIRGVYENFEASREAMEKLIETLLPSSGSPEGG